MFDLSLHGSGSPLKGDYDLGPHTLFTKSFPPSLLPFKPQEKTYEGKMFRQRNVTVVLPKFSVLKRALPRLKIYVLTHRLSISQSSWHLYLQPQFWLVSKGVIARLFGLGLHSILLLWLMRLCHQRSHSGSSFLLLNALTYLWN